MKTTIEISDALLKEAKALAARRKTTLRAVIEQGLHQVLSEPDRTTRFRLKRASFKGRGLNPELRDLSWSAIRELAYEAHGG
jgi:hypothetical protein